MFQPHYNSFNVYTKHIQIEKKMGVRKVYSLTKHLAAKKIVLYGATKKQVNLLNFASKIARTKKKYYHINDLK